MTRFLWNRLDQAVAARDGGGHPDRQRQVPGSQRPESPLLFFRPFHFVRRPRYLLLLLQGLFGHSPAGGDKQFGYAHAVVERLTHAQPREVNPPYRPLVSASEGRPQHAPDGQLPPHPPQLLLSSYEQLQTQGGR